MNVVGRLKEMMEAVEAIHCVAIYLLGVAIKLLLQ
jgi:hypothetical protein